MIIDFSVRNVASIKDFQTFSFEANDQIKDLEDYYVVEPVPGVKLLKLGLIYGANASGKSTVLKALMLLFRLMTTVRDAKNTTIDYSRFKLSLETRLSDSSYIIRFIVGNQCYKYEVEFNDKCILDEYLCSFDPITDEETEILTRTTDTENQVAVVSISPSYCTDMDINKKFGDSMRWNETIFAGFQHVNAIFPTLKKINDWLENCCYPVIEPNTSLYDYVSKRIESGEISKKNVIEMLRRADLMIDDIAFREDDKIPEELLLMMELAKSKGKVGEISHDIKSKHVEFHHISTSGDANLTYDEESLGTQRFYELCGLLDVMANEPGVFTIDEIDTSMHPDLLEYFLHAFICNTNSSQIIATIHNREILQNRELLRTDTIWFTEKSEDGSTELYSIEDFDPSIFTSDSSTYYRAYKNGRLGAKPKLGDYYINLKHNGEA